MRLKVKNPALPRRSRARLLSAIWALLFLFTFALEAFAEEPAPKADTGTTVRVGYVNVANYEEGREGERKRGAGYEYLQRIRYITGWQYEYVYCTFKEGLEMLISGEIDLFGDVSYTEERAQKVLYASLPAGRDTYWLYTQNSRSDLTTGDPASLAGMRIGVTESSYQQGLLNDWLSEKDISATVVPCLGQDDIFARLAAGELDAFAAPNLTFTYDYAALFSIGFSDYYFAVSKARPELLTGLNAALYEIQHSESDFNGSLAARYYRNLSGNLSLNDEEKAWLEAHGSTLRFGLLEDSLPFAGVDKTGALTGVLKVVADDLSETCGITCTVTEYTTSESMLAALYQGEVDIAGPVLTDFYAGEQYGHVLSNVILTTTPVLVTTSEKAGKAPKTIAISDNFIFNENGVSLLFPEAKTLSFSTLEACLTAIRNGSADATVITSSKFNRLRSNALFSSLECTELSGKVETGMISMVSNRRAISILNKAVYRTADRLSGMTFTSASVTDSAFTLSGFIKSNAQLFVAFFSLVLLVLSILVTSLLYQRARLKIALKRAHDASRAKTEFLFNMSHDIRTPMNAILGFTDIAKKCPDDPEKVLDCIQKTQQAGNLLLSLINSVLEMSRIESGKAELDEQPGMVDYSFSDIESTMQALAEKKGLDLSFSFGPIDDRYVYVDYERADRIFVNIISNAIKYTPAGGKVTVRCEQIGRKDVAGLYRFTVTDTGIGMSEEFQKHLFEEFSREQSSTVSGVQGSGLGLAVAKSFVELMGGYIECESALNEGTTFRITLPLRLQVNVPGVRYFDPVLQQYVESAPEAPAPETPVPDTPVPEAPAPEAQEEQPFLDGKRVLIVEDNEMNREIATFIAEDLGLITEEADDGTVAVDLLAEKGASYYDAILMDIQMPQMNGYEATRAIRAMYPDAPLVIIAVSANAFAEDRTQSLKAGMNAHIAKPLNVAELKETLERLLKHPPKPGQQAV